MARFTVFCLGLIFLCQAFALTGVALMAMGLFPLAVAWHWAAQQRERAAILVACATSVPLMFSGTLTDRIETAAIYGTVALVGILIGTALVRRWPYGWAIAWITPWVTGLMAAGMLSDWERSRENLRLALLHWQQQLNQAAKETGNTNIDTMLEMVSWLEVNWVYLFLGLLFGWVLLGSTITVGVLTNMLRIRNIPAGPKNSFIQMRTTEWLVWLAIATALLWFVDRQYDISELRIMVWNTGIALLFVYWLNGFSILLFTLRAFAIKPLLAMLVVMFTLLYQGSAPLVIMIGFFDTWWHVRSKVFTLAAKRSNKTNSDDT